MTLSQRVPDRKTTALAVASLFFAATSFLFVLRYFPGVPALSFAVPKTVYLISLSVSGLLLFGTVFFFHPFRKVGEWLPALLRSFGLPAIFAAVAWISNDAVPDIIRIAVSSYGLVAILWSVRILANRYREDLHAPRTDEPSVAGWIRKQGWKRLLAVAVLSAVFCVTALRDLGRFAAVDEALWLYGRIPKYWNALGSFEPSKTSISDKPGISVALATGPSLLAVPDPVEWKDYQGESHDIAWFFFVFRLPIVVLATILLPLFYYVLERLVRKTEAMFAFAFIALSPVTIGMTKIINPDSLLWIFVPMSLFSYLAYVKRRHVRYLFLSGILLGLALLTKYVANFLFVFVLGAIFVEYVIRKEEEPFLPYLRRSLLAYLVWTATALTTFFILFPATWVKPNKILNATIFSQAFGNITPLFIGLFAVILADTLLNRSRITETVTSFFRNRSSAVTAFIGFLFVALVAFVCMDVLLGMRPFDFMEILASPKTSFHADSITSSYVSNAYPLVFGITPTVFLLLLAAPFVSSRKRHRGSSAQKTVVLGFLFILLYYLGTTLNEVAAITRYQIVLYPVAASIAGITLGLIIKDLKDALPERLMRFRAAVFAGFLVIVTVSGIYSLVRTPFPLSYASSFLPQPYSLDVKDMGPGSYLAAQYLNSLPDSYKTTIWSDKDGVCKFYAGFCKSGFSWDAYEHADFSYVVVSSGRESRTVKRVNTALSGLRQNTIRFDEYYGKADPIWELYINGRQSHYVRIYRFEH
ncbi:MAG: phospholipid carrier-dependent glycosyltransferase [Candidatus Moranbacteria bacterium]|nr:phospholipid carrier-dependent glycosyltransferase [Candidatus Moranbacteria bacterium]